MMASFLLLALAFAWLFSPESMLAQWGVQYSDGAGVMSRRGAAFYIGIAAMLFMARGAEHSTARMAIVQGVIVALAALMLLGVYEFFAGHASGQILVAVLIEFVLVLMFSCVCCVSTKAEARDNLRRGDESARVKKVQ
ncbi:hypothetical protein [Pseudomonas sp. 8Z]|uniref:hypothetical protein n=1 Tax=Pseudomonas sp. 8Z TaxID=2653166 RepID=UPI0015B6C3D2|nr:hypothetical protein [Pseudomonas sp. 8Z]